MSETPPESSTTPASRTIASLMEAMETRPSAAFTQIVRLIQEITSKAESISVKELAEVIGSDLSTMTRVLGVANTIGYNPAGAEVTTVQQAVQTIGFEKIRNIALAILLLESAERGEAGTACRNVAGHALASATVAAALTEEAKGGEPEQTFVCAALRSYGDLILAHYLPELHKRANDPTLTGARDARYRAAFGLTSLEVAREILSRLQLPKPLLSTLRPMPVEAIQSKRPSAADRVMMTLDFASRFCEQLSHAKPEDGSIAEQAERFAKNYGNHFAWDKEAFERLFERVRQRLSSSGQAQGIRGFSSPLIQTLAGERPSVDLTARSPAADTAAAARGSAGEEGLEGLLHRLSGRTLGAQALPDLL
ncbi:MAG: HDOD domain-containing protein, partial [Verrucomicrobia bacterium]|nr:HDOD domain-containing protein [Verrucomicrobiota bacterium]